MFTTSGFLTSEEKDIDQVLGAIGMGGAKLLDCDSLATKLLDFWLPDSHLLI